jgi:hypothetical protein
LQYFFVRSIYENGEIEEAMKYAKKYGVPQEAFNRLRKISYQSRIAKVF